MEQHRRQRLATIVGANIAALRKMKGWNQIDLAERLGIGADSLSRMERGLVAPRFSRLELIANALGCSVAELFMTQEDREKLGHISLSYSEIDTCTKREVTLMAQKIIQLMK